MPLPEPQVPRAKTIARVGTGAPLASSRASRVLVRVHWRATASARDGSLVFDTRAKECPGLSFEGGLFSFLPQRCRLDATSPIFATLRSQRPIATEMTQSISYGHGSLAHVNFDHRYYCLTVDRRFDSCLFRGEHEDRWRTAAQMVYNGRRFIDLDITALPTIAAGIETMRVGEIAAFDVPPTAYTDLLLDFLYVQQDQPISFTPRMPFWCPHDTAPPASDVITESRATWCEGLETLRIEIELLEAWDDEPPYRPLGISQREHAEKVRVRPCVPALEASCCGLGFHFTARTLLAARKREGQLQCAHERVPPRKRPQAPSRSRSRSREDAAFRLLRSPDYPARERPHKLVRHDRIRPGDLTRRHGCGGASREDGARQRT